MTIYPYILAAALISTQCLAQKTDEKLSVTCDENRSLVIPQTIESELSEIVGRITSGYRKLSEAKVTLIQNSIVISEVRSDSIGSFMFQDIIPGDYVVRVELEPYNCSELRLKLKMGKSVDVEFELTPNQRMIKVVAEKPVIYLYPTKNEQLTVSLRYDGEILHSYPAIEGSEWHVEAEPNGTLRDATGMEYYALFWEGRPSVPLSAPDGFIVAGKDVARFLEEKLEFLGLNRREANEFIMYWLPRMENNPFNLIHFASNDYERIAELKVTPIPETMIRVMMLTQPLTSPIDFPTQDLSQMKKTRCGFTVVEWGGCEMRMKGL